MKESTREQFQEEIAAVDSLAEKLGMDNRAWKEVDDCPVMKVDYEQYTLTVSVVCDYFQGANVTLYGAEMRGKHKGSFFCSPIVADIEVAAFHMGQANWFKGYSRTNWPQSWIDPGWKGMSNETAGGGAIADTGDYEAGKWIPVDEIPLPNA